MISKDIVSSGGRYSMLEFFPSRCPLINKIRVPDIFLNQHTNISDVLIRYLTNAFCVMLEIDLYYIPQSSCYQQYHGWQPVLV